MTGNVSPLEVGWTLIAVLGLLFSGWLVLSTAMDLLSVWEAVRAVPPKARFWGQRWWVALGSVVGYAGISILWALPILIGIMAMSWPPPQSNPEQQLSNLKVGWLFIGGELLALVLQAWFLIVRNRIERAPKWSG
jgi:hypothetical protein